MRLFSADHFFINPRTGAYEFNPAQLPEAHGSCLRGFVGAVLKGARRITILRGIPGAGKTTWATANAAALDLVVDNTAVHAADVAPYAALALAYRVPFEVVTLRVPPAIAAARNIHGVPVAAVHRAAQFLDRGTKDLPPRWPHRVID